MGQVRALGLQTRRTERGTQGAGPGRKPFSAEGVGARLANMAVQLEIGALVGALVRLEPLVEGHVDALASAASEDRSSYGYTAVPEGRPAMLEHVRGLLAMKAAGQTLPFAQVRIADGQPVGVTRFLSFRHRGSDPIPYAVEIGGTWLGESAQRRGINTEAKLLLLSHAFEVWKVGRVDLKTDARNQRSRAAIAGIGATLEGVLRSWQPSHATGEDTCLRDSAMYSILASEWSHVRKGLEVRLGWSQSQALTQSSG